MLVAIFVMLVIVAFLLMVLVGTLGIAKDALLRLSPVPVPPEPQTTTSFGYPECGARHNIWTCTKPINHDGQHGEAGVFWGPDGD